MRVDHIVTGLPRKVARANAYVIGYWRDKSDVQTIEGCNWTRADIVESLATGLIWVVRDIVNTHKVTRSKVVIMLATAGADPATVELLSRAVAESMRADYGLYRISNLGY